MLDRFVFDFAAGADGYIGGVFIAEAALFCIQVGGHRDG
jgi:hypothetical protein